jgi:nitrogen fixation NifU-like protein
MHSIYQDRLLALARYVREQKATPLEKPTHSAEVNNPVCGDYIGASIIIKNNVIVAAHADAKGCALCEAGAGLWLNSVAGQTMSSLTDYHDALTSWLAGQGDQNGNVVFAFGLDSFEPVRAIKNRHKCVTLAFSTADKFKKN